MRKILLLILSILIVTACGTVRYVPVEAKTDSIYVEKIIERKDTVYFNIPVEVKDIITYADSSHLETSVAVSDAWVDSLSIFHHRLQNKAETALKKEVNHKDKIIEKEVIKEVPVIKEVEVPVEVIPIYYQRINAAFWILLSILILIIGWKFLKFFKGFL